MIRRWRNMTDLWHGSAEEMFTAPKVDLVTSSDTIFYDNVLTADSMDFDFDAGRDLWLPASRFTKLKRDYLDPDELDSFLDRCEKIGRKDNNRGVVTQMPPAIHDRAVGKYQWGNCIIGWTFRGGGRHTPVLSMHSRTTYIAYMGGMDLALCAVLARYIGERIDRDPAEFQFRWAVDSLMFHDFKSIPYVLNRPKLMRYVDDDDFAGADLVSPKFMPTVHKVRKTFAWIDRQNEDGVPWHAEKFGPRKRIRRRYHQWDTGETVPSVPLASLNLEDIRR